MPAKPSNIPSPWKEFLREIDETLKETLELYCIGGFVFAYFYGLPRSTSDLDYSTAAPSNVNLDELAGEGSPLHKKYKVHLHRVAVMTMPEGYEVRSSEMFPGNFRHLKLYVPDPYDSLLSKLERNDSKDRDDANYLFRSKKLNVDILRNRYRERQRPYLLSREQWHDSTLEMWIEIFTI